MANEIDPRILEQRVRTVSQRVQSRRDQRKDVTADWDGPETTPQLTGMPVEPVVHFAALRGSPAQIKWATTIRQSALALAWPYETALKLRGIHDATWWIANKAIVSTMKFKEPSPDQMLVVGHPGGQPVAQSTAPAAPLSSRLNDAAAFAESVSRHPLTAEATILALLAKLYKSPMKDELLAKARAKRKQANFEITRDVDAIDKLLA